MRFLAARAGGAITITAQIVGDPSAMVGSFVLNSLTGTIGGHQLNASSWEFSVAPTAPDTPLTDNPFNLWTINPNWLAGNPDIEVVASQGGAALPNLDPPLAGKGPDVLVSP